jgi:hypothetical protein
VKLYKTVIEIWTEEPTENWELEDLAKEAVSGSAVLAECHCEVYVSPFLNEHPDVPADHAGYKVPEGVLSFFNVVDENDTPDPDWYPTPEGIIR